MKNGSYCYLDIDIDHSRTRLATCAAFVDATNLTYGFSSKDLLRCGGSEVSRLRELIATDHKWSAISAGLPGGRGMLTSPPAEGNRIVVRLYWDVAPMACENFATLCSNGSSSSSSSGRNEPNKGSQKAEKAKPVPIGDCGKPLTYKDCKVHRIIPGFVLQAGDFVLENGSGGECVFKNKKVFKDERAGLNLKHDRFGLLSMGNSGKNSNSSQFFFTLGSAPQCDGKHVIFGECVSGGDILRKAEGFGSSNGEPTVPITITDCGIFHPFHTPGAGFWYDKPDPESWSGTSPTFVVRPRVAILAPSEKARKTFVKAIGEKCSVVASISLPDNEDPSGEEGTATIGQVEERLSESLSNFSTDVILISPACRDVKTRLKLPGSWTDASFTIDEVVLVAKPVEALKRMHAQSWLSKHRGHWHLDGRR